MAIQQPATNPLDGNEWPSAYTRAVRLSLDLIPSQFPGAGNQPVQGGPAITAGIKGHVGFHQWASEAACKQQGLKANPDFNVFIELDEADLLLSLRKTLVESLTDDPAAQTTIREALTAAGVADLAIQELITREVYRHPKVIEHPRLQGAMV